MAETKKIDKMVESSIKQVTDLIDVNTIIGNPIETQTAKLIPVSKVTMGFLSGGGEYGTIKVNKQDDYPFSGGTGAIVNLKPCAFLVDDGKDIKVLRITDDAIEEVLTKAGETLQSFFSN